MKVTEKVSGSKLWYKVEGSENVLSKIARILKIDVKREGGRNPDHCDLSEHQYRRIKNRV